MDPVSGSVARLTVKETAFGPMYEFELAGSERTHRVRWRAPSGSRLTLGDRAEVYGPVDSNGILEAQSVSSSRPGGNAPWWRWLAAPPVIAAAAWLEEAEPDFVLVWIVVGVGLAYYARRKTAGVTRALLDIVGLAIAGTAALLAMSTSGVSALARLGRLLSIPSAIVATVLLIRHRLSRGVR